MKRLILITLMFCGLGVATRQSHRLNHSARTHHLQPEFLCGARTRAARSESGRQPRELRRRRRASGAGFRHPARSRRDARCRSSSRTIATILFRRSCCFRSTRARTIDFSVGRTAEGKNITVRGKVIRSGYIPSTYYAQNYQQPVSTQPIIEVDGVLRFGLPGQPLFPALSADSVLKPTLNWLLQTNDPGKFDAEISYVSGGMSWQADYNLVVSDNPNGKTDLLDMVGWITMRNQSGKTFENASIKLMAGDVNKMQEVPMAKRAYAAAKLAMEADAAAPVVREKSFDEFHLYTLERPTTLRDQETKQVEFVRSTGIHAQRIYVYDGAKVDQYGYYNPEQIRQDQNYGTQFPIPKSG